VVDEAMLQGVENPYGLIFCILSIERSVFIEFDKVMFYEGEWP
jgi:hypothetical protein